MTTPDEVHSAQVWIGLAEVRQRPGAQVLMDRNHAVVNVLALSRDEREFRATVASALSAAGFDLVDLEDPESLQVRRSRYMVDDGLLLLADRVLSTGTPQFGNFHTWVADE